MHYIMYVFALLFVFTRGFTEENNTSFEDVIFKPLRQIGQIGSRSSASIGINGDTIFILGGYLVNKTIEGSIWSFDTRTGWWTLVCSFC